MLKPGVSAGCCCVVQDDTKGAEVRELMAKAFKGALLAHQQQQVRWYCVVVMHCSSRKQRARSVFGPRRRDANHSTPPGSFLARPVVRLDPLASQARPLRGVIRAVHLTDRLCVGSRC